jgi:spermidine synthase
VSETYDASPRASHPVVFKLVTAVFFLSGAAGLVYQVLWMRSLGLFFGSDMYGVSIILSAFMGGLALGSWLGGRLAEHTPRPLMWYGLAELGIGLAALRFHPILESFDPLLEAAYATASAGVPWSYQAARVVLAAGTLLVPTTLMGATLPLIMRHFVRSRSVLGESGAYFYAVNTLGALFGTLAAGFVLLPQLGMSRSTLCAAAVNLAIGIVCVAIGRRSSVPRAAGVAPLAELDPLPGLEARVRRRLSTAALLAFGLSGFCSFALEVLWTRILLISFSATIYSFASTLVCFLFGIFLGSRLVGRVVDHHRDPVRLFAALELGCGASVAVLALLLHALPDVFGWLLGTLAASLQNGREHALVLATLLASFPLLVVPATLLGATFPVALRIYTTNVAHVGSRTGAIYAANTLGAVVGALAAGLVLIPSLGAMASLVLVAALFLSIGVGLAAVAERSVPTYGIRRPIGLAVATTFVCGVGALLLPYRVTLNFAQETLADAELLYHAEGIQNTVDVVRSESGATSLIIGGNVEADDGHQQRPASTLRPQGPPAPAPDGGAHLRAGRGTRHGHHAPGHGSPPGHPEDRRDRALAGHRGGPGASRPDQRQRRGEPPRAPANRRRAPVHEAQPEALRHDHRGPDPSQDLAGRIPVHARVLPIDSKTPDERRRRVPVDAPLPDLAAPASLRPEDLPGGVSQRDALVRRGAHASRGEARLTGDRLRDSGVEVR